MANTHPANLGDVLKHLFLCEALSAQPLTYIDSHAGAFSYELADAPDPGLGGIWDFAHMAAADAVLGGSVYARIALPRAGTPNAPGTYLGSVGLADLVLRPIASIIAAETNEDTAAGLEAAFRHSPRNVQVMGAPFEGQDVVANMADSGSLALIDPFDVREKSVGNLSSIEAFRDAALRGATTFMWYPLIEREEDTPWVSEILGPAGIQPLQMEIRSSEKAAGLWGCGILAVRLPAKVYLAFTPLWAALRQALIALVTKYDFVTRR